MLSGRLLSYLKKRKISQNGHSLYHSLSFVITRCPSLSFVVPLVVIRCTTRCHWLYHSLSFVVTRCHSLSLLVSRCTTCLSIYKRSLVETQNSITIDGTPRLLIIPFFAALPNLIQHSPSINFGEFCRLLFYSRLPVY